MPAPIFNGDSGEGSFHGVFVAAGSEPTETEIAQAREKLASFHSRLVENADLEWERSHNLMFITDLERRAARELKLDKPWVYDHNPQAECPACGETIKPDVAVCKTCGAILDRDKAAQYGLIKEAEVPEPAKKKNLQLRPLGLRPSRTQFPP